MQPLTTTWRASLWARWLGWTLVFPLVSVASVLALAEVGGVLGDALVPALAAPSLVAAFLIGLRFRSWSWLAGPAAAIVALYVPLGVVLFGTSRWPSGLEWQRTGLPAELLFISIIAGALVIGIVHALPAGAGVWWGKRRAQPRW